MVAPIADRSAVEVAAQCARQGGEAALLARVVNQPQHRLKEARRGRQRRLLQRQRLDAVGKQRESVVSRVRSTGPRRTWGLSATKNVVDASSPLTGADKVSRSLSLRATTAPSPICRHNALSPRIAKTTNVAANCLPSMFLLEAARPKRSRSRRPWTWLGRRSAGGRFSRTTRESGWIRREKPAKRLLLSWLALPVPSETTAQRESCTVKETLTASCLRVPCRRCDVPGAARLHSASVCQPATAHPSGAGGLTSRTDSPGRDGEACVEATNCNGHYYRQGLWNGKAHGQGATASIVDSRSCVWSIQKP